MIIRFTLISKLICLLLILSFTCYSQCDPCENRDSMEGELDKIKKSIEQKWKKKVRESPTVKLCQCTTIDYAQSDKNVIYYNPNKIGENKDIELTQFVLYHELGHYYLGHLSSVNFGRDTLRFKDYFSEFEADAFADIALSDMKLDLDVLFRKLNKYENEHNSEEEFQKDTDTHPSLSRRKEFLVELRKTVKVNKDSLFTNLVQNSITRLIIPFYIQNYVKKDRWSETLINRIANDPNLNKYLRENQDIKNSLKDTLLNALVDNLDKGVLDDSSLIKINEALDYYKMVSSLILKEKNIFKKEIRKLETLKYKIELLNNEKRHLTIDPIFSFSKSIGIISNGTPENTLSKKFHLNSAIGIRTTYSKNWGKDYKSQPRFFYFLDATFNQFSFDITNKRGDVRLESIHYKYLGIAPNIAITYPLDISRKSKFNSIALAAGIPFFIPIKREYHNFLQSFEPRSAPMGFAYCNKNEKFNATNLLSVIKFRIMYNHWDRLARNPSYGLSINYNRPWFYIEPDLGGNRRVFNPVSILDITLSIRFWR